MSLVEIDKQNDELILNDDKVPAPVKLMWTKLKDREAYLKEQNKLNTVYINDFQQRDNNYETVNYINYVWQEIMIYGLSNEIINAFKMKLQNIYSLVKK